MGAPAVLSMYGFKGWFIGMQNSRYPMYIAIAVNVINIACSLFFVFGLGMKVEGVALGTVVAEYSGLCMAIWLWRKEYGFLRSRFVWQESIRFGAMRRFCRKPGYFFAYALFDCCNDFFTSSGARQGNVILAVNTLLMQLFTLFHMLWMDSPMRQKL